MIPPELVKGSLLGLASAASPGPLQSLLVARATRAGPTRALPLALVPATTDPLVIAVVLTLLVHVPSGAKAPLQALGIAVMLAIALLTLRSALHPAPLAPGAAPARGFLQALLVNAANPNAWIFWSATGGIALVDLWAAGPAHALWFLGGFYVCITAGNAAVILAAGSLARSGPRAARVLGLASGVALTGFVGWQLLELFRAQ